MKHLEDGQIRAALDGELDEQGTRHLDQCADCQTRLSNLRAELQSLQKQLSFLASPPENPVPNARAALARYQHRFTEKKEKSMFKRVFASSILRVSLAVVVLLVLVLSVPATRAWAGEFLGLFRVQQVAVVPIDTSGLEQLSGNSTLSKQINQLVASSVTVTKKPGTPEKVSSAAEGSTKAGFTVRLPEQAPSTPVLSVQGGAAYQFKIDLARAQAVLDEAGRKDLVLPETLNGADISVDIPASARAAYGTCPDLQKESDGAGLNLNGSNGRKFSDCIILSEIPSPTVNTPPNVDIQQLAVIGLEFTGMTHQQAEEFSQTVDWTTSLVIPIPRDAAIYKKVTVDGVEGTLIERPVDDAPQFALIWVKDGIVYAIGGLGNRADQAIQMANSLQ